jgi:hypothetical protein
MQHVSLDTLTDGPGDLDTQREDGSETQGEAAHPHRAVVREDEDVSHSGQTGLSEHCCGPKKHKGVVRLLLSVDTLDCRNIVVALRNTKAL